MKPGETILAAGDIEGNAGRKTTVLTVANTGDRPVQVGSHFHFFEVNKALRFERARAFGFRLNIPAGTAVRFEPGEEKEVALVEFGGKKTVYGLNHLTDGSLRLISQPAGSVAKAAAEGFQGAEVQSKKEEGKGTPSKEAPNEAPKKENQNKEAPSKGGVKA